MNFSLEKERILKIKREHSKRIVDSYFKEVIQPYFPNCTYRNATDEYIDGVHLAIGSIIRFEPINAILEGSDYYYDNDKLKFIHYTTLNNFLNIIREESIRIYNLDSMDDSIELKYASSSVFKGLGYDQIQNWKKHVYTFSMCELDIEENNDSLDLWRRYGNDGKGIGFVVSIDKRNQFDWYKRYLSKIYYESDTIKGIINKHIEFLKKEKGFHILGDNQELLLNLCSFHKPPIYKNEKEVRYLEFDNNYPNVNNISLGSIITGDEFPLALVQREKNAWENYKKKLSVKVNTEAELDISKNLQPVNFKRIAVSANFHNKLLNKIECPLIKSNYEKYFPKFQIEKAILGYRYSSKELKNIKTIINELAKKKLGYSFGVEITSLKKYF